MAQIAGALAQARDTERARTLAESISGDRKTEVQVMRSMEVYFMEFAGHSSPDFAYEDEDRHEVLQGRIELAVQTTAGPTRITLDQVDEVIIQSVIVIDP